MIPRSASLPATGLGVALATAVLAPAPLLSDTIEMKNGDRITGQIIERTDDQLIIQYPGLGEIHIDKALIDQVVSTGDSRQPNPAASAPAGEQKTAEKTTTTTPPPPPRTTSSQAGGEESQGSEPSSQTPTETPTETPKAEKPEQPFFGEDFFPNWEKQLEAGFSGSEGNSQSFNVSAALKLKHESDRTRTDLTASYFRDSSDGELTRNQFQSKLKQDWLVPDQRYFYFGQLGYEYDTFEAYESRVSAFGGVGYDFYKSKPFTLTGRLGVGGNYEFGEVNELTPEALLGLDVTYQINQTQSLEFSNTLYPSLSHGGEFRNTTTFDWTLSLDHDGDENKGLSLKFGIQNEYESDVEPGIKNNDLLYFGRLVYGF